MPPSLAPLAGATDIKFTEGAEGSGIFYRVAATSGSRRLPSELAKQLGSEWTPKRLQLRDLGLPKDEAGWVDIGDDEDGIEGYYWSTEWESVEGDELFYSMIHMISLAGAAGDPSVGNVEIHGWMTPSELVERPCDLGAESSDQPRALVQPDLLVLRGVSDTPSPDRRESAALLGSVYYFDPTEAVLRGESFLQDGIQALEESDSRNQGEAIVLLCLTETGRRHLEDWTRDNVANYLGFFVAGELTYAPRVNGAVRHGFLRMPAPTLEAAQLIRQRLIGEASSGEQGAEGLNLKSTGPGDQQSSGPAS